MALQDSPGKGLRSLPRNAHPLKRAVEQRVVAPLAWQLAARGPKAPKAVTLAAARGEIELRWGEG